MAFDGIFIHHLTKEIAPLLVDGRIDKIYQSDKHTMVFHIRGNRTQHLLHLSVDPTHPYFCLRHEKSTNPMEPPMFCMLMRKILTSGRILSFKQEGLERIVTIDVEVRNELGDKVTRRLILEVMGKHSNLILVDPTTQPPTVIDSIKRVPEHLSRLRPMLPGLPYLDMPRTKNCLLDQESAMILPGDPLDFEGAQKWLVKHYEGFSPILSRNLLHAFGDLETYTPENLSLILYQFKNKLCNHPVEDHTQTAYVRMASHEILVDLGVYPLSSEHTCQVTESVNEAAALFFIKRNKQTQLKNKAAQMRRMIQTRIEGLSNKLTKLHIEAQEATGSERFKELGDLILANLYQIKSGDSEAVVVNYYDPNGETITIPLDLRLTPSENAQRYFKKYNKYKTACVEIDKQLEEARHELNYFENVLVSLDQSEELVNIEEIESELASLGYLKRKFQRHKKSTLKSLPFVYEVCDGDACFTVWAGKNNVQNDRLTLKDASNSDLWFHTKDIPGSHVILRCEGKTPSNAVCHATAKIAAYHSKGKLSSQVPVDFTTIRNVHKPSGAKHGMVIYDSQSTIYATPVESEILSWRR